METKLKHQELVLIGKPLKHYAIYFDTEYGEIIEERDRSFFVIAEKGEFHSLRRKLEAIDQKFKGWRKYAKKNKVY